MKWDNVKEHELKDMLEDWMIVEYRRDNVGNGKYAVVNTKTRAFISLGGYNDSNSWRPDLTYDQSRSTSGWDVMAIYAPVEEYFDGLSKIEPGDLLWKRKEKSEAQLKLEKLEREQRAIADKIKQLREEL